ncbi:low molecular weight neuronal intermediate filament-like [Genypterus blacodes]|uniref:low molecular weight neuronal intermediate filament-like n=1 Tax=Genypterus blacodes TaxID=154954 RepID=UPI003F761C36
MENEDIKPDTAVIDECKKSRIYEKKEMQKLNERFATFIKRVRNLEQHNKVLETKSIYFQQRTTEISRLDEMYRERFSELKSQLDALSEEKSKRLIEQQEIQVKLKEVRSKYDYECRARVEAEAELKDFKKNFNIEKLKREMEVTQLMSEMEFVRKTYTEEITTLTTRISSTTVTVEVDSPEADLNNALKEIRDQYEDWYKNKLEARGKEAIRISQEEVEEMKSQLYSKTTDIKSLKMTNESLETQIREMKSEIESFKNSTTQLDDELRKANDEVVRHLSDYKDLLNVKMELDLEIEAYRNLLEGEETRIGYTANETTDKVRQERGFFLRSIEIQSEFARNAWRWMKPLKAQQHPANS